MKKSALRTLVWVLLIAASSTSYLYLNCESVQVQDTYGLEDRSEELQDTEQETKVLLPDIALIKKMITLSKVFLGRH